MPDTCVFLLSYTLHELGGGGQRYASLKGQSHINIYIRLINYAQIAQKGDLSFVVSPSRIPADGQRDRPVNNRYI